MDADGYPTEDELRRVREWRDDYHALMDFVSERWMFANAGYWSIQTVADDFSHPVVEYRASTAGWSGNEWLIAAMTANRPFWATAWYSSRRGGHYVFRLPPR